MKFKEIIRKFLGLEFLLAMCASILWMGIVTVIAEGWFNSLTFGEMSILLVVSHTFFFLHLKHCVERWEKEKLKKENNGN